MSGGLHPVCASSQVGGSDIALHFWGTCCDPSGEHDPAKRGAASWQMPTLFPWFRTVGISHFVGHVGHSGHRRSIGGSCIRNRRFLPPVAWSSPMFRNRIGARCGHRPGKHDPWLGEKRHPCPREVISGISSPRLLCRSFGLFQLLAGHPMVCMNRGRRTRPHPPTHWHQRWRIPRPPTFSWFCSLGHWSTVQYAQRISG